MAGRGGGGAHQRLHQVIGIDVVFSLYYVQCASASTCTHLWRSRSTIDLGNKIARTLPL